MSVVLREEPTATFSWQPPPFEYTREKGVGWVEEMIQEGEGYLSGQASYKNLTKNLAIFNGIYNDQTKSGLQSNFLKYCIRKFVETISDVREIGTVGSDANQFKSYAEIENNVIKHIYAESQFPRALRQTLQWASVTGVGYLWPKCKALDYGFGERRIIFEPLGILDVAPVQVPKTNDVQDAYVATVFEYMPIAEAHARFPLFQSKLVPVNSCKFPTRIGNRRLDWAEKWRYGQNGVEPIRNWGNLYCEVRYTFVRDLRINTSGKEFPMGDLNTSWFFKVPFVGQDIPGGVVNNQRVMRKATMMDARVYPQLRLLITSPSVPTPMYDGPAFDWHGKIPTIQYTVDDWPWQALGTSLVENVASLEQTKRKHERKMDQVVTTRLNPPMGYDRTATGGPKVEKFDLFEENVRMGGDGKPQDTFQSLLPETVVVTATNFDFRKMIVEMMEQQLGINDLGNVMNAKLNLSSDTFEKAIETIGPIAKGIAAAMEAGNAKIAELMKWMVPQWMDTKRIIEYIGPDRITQEVLDYDPGSLIPSHLEDEPERFEEINGEQRRLASSYTQIERARHFARNLRVKSVPSTLLKITQMQEQLKYLQLYRGGFPISPHTVAKKLGIDNFGEIEGNTEFEKWVNWKKTEIALAAASQEFAAKLGAGGGPPGGGPHAGGRPPSGGAPPAIKQKGKGDGKPRTTVTESK